MRRRTLLLALGAGLAATLAAAAPAVAAVAPSPPKYVLGPGSTTFTTTGAHPVFTVSIHNGTALASPAVTVLSRARQPGCTATVSPQTVAPNAWTSVAVTLSGCTLSDGAFSAVVKVGTATLGAVEVAAATTNPHWSYLYAFPLLLVVYLAFLGWATLRRWRPTPGQDSLWAYLRSPLPQLGSGWSVTESWAANLTVAAAALAGIFGSGSVVTAIFGSTDDPVYALTTVAAAIAVAVAAAAPLAVGAAKDNGYVTRLGLLAGATLTVGATSGELVVIALAVRQLDLGGVQSPLALLGGVLGLALLATYAYRAVDSTLVRPAEGEVFTPGPGGRRRTAVL